MISARREFMEAFLGALGAAEIVTWCERETEVSGTLRLAEDDERPDLTGDDGMELQDFSWRQREQEAPSLLTFRLAEVMRRYHLLEVDRLRVSKATLRMILQQDFDEPVAESEFEAALSALLAIEVTVLEDGKPTENAFRIRL